MKLLQWLCLTGPFNSWGVYSHILFSTIILTWWLSSTDRQVYAHQFKTDGTTLDVQKDYDEIRGNFFLGNYYGQEAIDNDDGSAFCTLLLDLVHFETSKHLAPPTCCKAHPCYFSRQHAPQFFCICWHGDEKWLQWVRVILNELTNLRHVRIALLCALVVGMITIITTTYMHSLERAWVYVALCQDMLTSSIPTKSSWLIQAHMLDMTATVKAHGTEMAHAQRCTTTTFSLPMAKWQMYARLRCQHVRLPASTLGRVWAHGQPMNKSLLGHASYLTFLLDVTNPLFRAIV
eukprot:SAG31_NODE_6744_length_1903_cov_1.449557_1_plen_290_part_00